MGGAGQEAAQDRGSNSGAGSAQQIPAITTVTYARAFGQELTCAVVATGNGAHGLRSRKKVQAA